MTDPALKDLDDMLAQAAEQRPDVPSVLMARVMIDAAQVQPRQTHSLRQGIWANLLEMVGGWPSVGGLAMAGMAGLWIGFAPPSSLETMTTTWLGTTQTVDMFGGDALSNLSDELDG